MIFVCRDCHQQLTRRQYRWAIDWQHQQRPVYCILQGVSDCLAVWVERSPYSEPLRALLSLLFHAALALLGCLRADALADIGLLADTTNYRGSYDD